MLKAANKGDDRDFFKVFVRELSLEQRKEFFEKYQAAAIAEGGFPLLPENLIEKVEGLLEKEWELKEVRGESIQSRLKRRKRKKGK
jgi:hypothetical protein